MWRERLSQRELFRPHKFLTMWVSYRRYSSPYLDYYVSSSGEMGHRDARLEIFLPVFFNIYIYVWSGVNEILGVSILYATYQKRIYDKQKRGESERSSISNVKRIDFLIRIIFSTFRSPISILFLHHFILFPVPVGKREKKKWMTDDIYSSLSVYLLGVSSLFDFLESQIWGFLLSSFSSSFAIICTDK